MGLDFVPSDVVGEGNMLSEKLFPDIFLVAEWAAPTFRNCILKTEKRNGARKCEPNCYALTGLILRAKVAAASTH